MDKRCEHCNGTMVTVRADALYCSTRCRVAGNRARKRIPAVMRDSDRWVRARGKVPLTLAGRNASSTDPTTWSSFKEVQAAAIGDGFGFMLGGGIGCYDLDDVTDAEARELIERIPEPVLFVERSMSGRGVHVFVELAEGAGSKSWAGRFERYSKARFIRMTGKAFKLN